MATGFPKNAHRLTPYAGHMFRVIMDGVPVAGVSKVGQLHRTTTVITHRSGGENGSDHKAPGRTQYDAITLERGITHSPEFEAWANRVHPADGDGGMDLVGYRKELTLEVLNEKGQVAMRYFLHGCWVSEFTAMPQLDAGTDAIAIEMIKIELESWSRDVDTKEPTEASDPSVVN